MSIPDSVLQQSGLDPGQGERLLKFLKNLKISYEMPKKKGTPGFQKRIYRVSGLGANAEEARCVCKTISNRLFFSLQNRTSICIAQEDEI